MEIHNILQQVARLPEESRAEIAKALITSLQSKQLLLNTWSESWLDWVQRHTPQVALDLDRARNFQDDLQDIVAEQSILHRSQVERLLDQWFSEVPYLVLSHYDSQEHCSAADPNGGVLMHPVVAVTNGVIGIDNAIAKGVFKSFEEYEELDDRWNERRAG